MGQTRDRFSRSLWGKSFPFVHQINNNWLPYSTFGLRLRNLDPGPKNRPPNLTPLFDIYRYISAVIKLWPTHFWRIVALLEGFSKVSKYVDQSSPVSRKWVFSFLAPLVISPPFLNYGPQISGVV